MIRNLSLGFIFYIGIICLGGFYVMPPDGTLRIELAHSVATEGSLISSAGPVKYAPLQSILMAPFYAIGYYSAVITGAPPQNFRKIGALYLLYLFLPIVISALCVLFFRILKKMGVDNNASLVSTFLLFGGTFFLPYARGLFPEPLNALLILLSFNYFYFAPSTHYLSSNRKNFFCLGLLILNNFIFVLYFGLMIAYVFWASRVKRNNPSEAWRAVLEGSLILGVSVALFLGYNYYRYGQFLDFGYHGEGFSNNLMLGMYGLVLSFGRGLLFFSPLTVLCIGYFIYKNREMEAWPKYAFCTVLISFVSYLGVYSKWDSWHGGLCWGPRFLLPFVPLFHLMFPRVLQFFATSNRWVRVGIFLTAAWGLAMNLVYYLNPLAIFPVDKMDISASEYGLRMFALKHTIVYKTFGQELDPVKILKFTVIMGLCALLLWAWRNRLRE